METDSTQKVRKASIIPVSHVAWELHLSQPYPVAESLTFESTEDLLKPELFNLWRDMISKRERDEIAAVRFALIHRFQSAGHMGREEADSDDYAFKVFLCLRLIKPTKSTFQRIQVKLVTDKTLEVFSFQHPGLLPNVPDSESINEIGINDIRRLGILLPSFLDVASKGPENIRRAIRHFNVGYTQVQDPTVQIVVWMMGIEALFTGEEETLSHDELMRRVDQAVDFDTDIYESSPMREYIGTKSSKVGELFEDLLILRNRFVHGQWIPSEWKSRPGRNSLGSTPINYADVLREVASFVLRLGILKRLETHRGFEDRQ